MDEKAKIVEKKKLENMYKNNKKSRSRFIDNTSAAATNNNNINQKHYVLKSHNNILEKNNNTDLENIDYINNILAEKMSSLNISKNNGFISPSRESGNEEIKPKPNNYKKPIYNEDNHNFINDTTTLKNNNHSFHRPDFETTIDNITSNTENLIFLPPNTNNVNKNQMYKKYYRKDNHILSDIHDILNTKTINEKKDDLIIKEKNNKESSLIKNKRKHVTSNNHNNYFNNLLPTDNIDLLFKKKINSTSFLNGIDDDNNLKPVLSTFKKKAPSIHSVKSEPDNDTYSLFNDNIKDNNTNFMSVNHTFDGALGSNFLSQNDQTIMSNNGSFDIKDNDKSLVLDFTGNIESLINGRTQSIKSNDSIFEYDIGHSNNINSRINFIKEKYLDLQNNKEEKTENMLSPLSYTSINQPLNDSFVNNKYLKNKQKSSSFDELKDIINYQIPQFSGHPSNSIDEGIIPTEYENLDQEFINDLFEVESSFENPIRDLNDYKEFSESSPQMMTEEDNIPVKIHYSDDLPPKPFEKPIENEFKKLVEIIEKDNVLKKDEDEKEEQDIENNEFIPQKLNKELKKVKPKENKFILENDSKEILLNNQNSPLEESLNLRLDDIDNMGNGLDNYSDNVNDDELNLSAKSIKTKRSEQPKNVLVEKKNSKQNRNELQNNDNIYRTEEMKQDNVNIQLEQNEMDKISNTIHNQELKEMKQNNPMEIETQENHNEMVIKNGDAEVNENNHEDDAQNLNNDEERLETEYVVNELDNLDSLEPLEPLEPLKPLKPLEPQPTTSNLKNLNNRQNSKNLKSLTNQPVIKLNEFENKTDKLEDKITEFEDNYKIEENQSAKPKNRKIKVNRKTSKSKEVNQMNEEEKPNKLKNKVKTKRIIKKIKYKKINEAEDQNNDPSMQDVQTDKIEKVQGDINNLSINSDFNIVEEPLINNEIEKSITKDIDDKIEKPLTKDIDNDDEIEKPLTDDLDNDNKIEKPLIENTDIDNKIEEPLIENTIFINEIEEPLIKDTDFNNKIEKVQEKKHNLIKDTDDDEIEEKNEDPSKAKSINGSNQLKETKELETHNIENNSTIMTSKNIQSKKIEEENHDISIKINSSNENDKIPKENFDDIPIKDIDFDLIEEIPKENDEPTLEISVDYSDNPNEAKETQEENDDLSINVIDSNKIEKVQENNPNLPTINNDPEIIEKVQENDPNLPTISNDPEIIEKVQESNHDLPTVNNDPEKIENIQENQNDKPNRVAHSNKNEELHNNIHRNTSIKDTVSNIENKMEELHEKIHNISIRRNNSNKSNKIEELREENNNFSIRHTNSSKSSIIEEFQEKINNISIRRANSNNKVNKMEELREESNNMSIRRNNSNKSSIIEEFQEKINNISIRRASSSKANKIRELQEKTDNNSIKSIHSNRIKEKNDDPSLAISVKELNETEETEDITNDSHVMKINELSLSESYLEENATPSRSQSYIRSRRRDDISKNFSINNNYSICRYDDVSYSYDYSNDDDKNSINTLYEPSLQIDISDSEYVDDDSIGTFNKISLKSICHNY